MRVSSLQASELILIFELDDLSEIVKKKYSNIFPSFIFLTGKEI